MKGTIALLCVCAAVLWSGSAFADMPPLRAGWAGVTIHNHTDRSMITEMKRRGMNAVVLSIENLSDEQKMATFTRWSHWAAELDMMLFPIVELYSREGVEHYPIGERHYVDTAGKIYDKTPCPADRAFWDKKVTRSFVRLANWAKDHPNVRAIVVDTEMYGANRAAFISACHCRFCLAEIGDDKDAEASVKLVRRNVERTAQAVWAIDPTLTLGGTLLDHLRPDLSSVPPFYKAMTLAWGKPDRPVLVLSEALYEREFHAAFAHEDRPLLREVGSYVEGRPRTFGIGDRPEYVDLWLNKYKRWGAHAQFLGSLWIERIPHENVAENFYHMSAHTGGYWLYEVKFIKQMPKHRAEAYWNAIEKANHELDRLADDPKYVSALKMRPFTLPAPAVNLDRFRQTRVDLPAKRVAVGDPGLFFKTTEQIIMLAAEAGETVTLNVLASGSSRNKLKEDAVPVVVVDPSGQVIVRDKITIEDMLAAGRQKNGLYTARKQVQFQASTSGVYGLYLKSVRYGFTVESSSHAWGASLAWPGTRHHTRVDRPKAFYVKTLPGAKQIRWLLTAAPSAPIGVRVLNDAGETLLTTQIVSSDRRTQRGTATIKLSNESGEAQRLKLVFDRTARDLNIYPDQGLAPWLTAHPEAPFPIEVAK